MRCTEFLELYSEYRDGLIASSALERSMLRHVATCQTCMRYNARVSRGVTAMRAFSDLEPTAGFRGELDGRLARAAMVEEEPVLPGPTGLMVGPTPSLDGASPSSVLRRLRRHCQPYSPTHAHRS